MSDEFKPGERVRVDPNSSAMRAGEMGTVVGPCEYLPGHLVVRHDNALNNNVYGSKSLLRAMEIEGVVDTENHDMGGRRAEINNERGEPMLLEAIKNLDGKRVRVTIEVLP